MKVAVIDYGMGNIKSVSNAVRYLGYTPKVVDRPEKLVGDKIIIPGVGAFGDAMRNLNSFLPKISGALEDEKSILGICLGMQILFEASEESPQVKGLSFLKGKTLKIKTNQKLPHIGWNSLKIRKNSCPLFKGINNGYVYYAHTYHPLPENDIIAATSEYGSNITASVWNENIYGVQFHPEKSGKVGLNILNNFLEV